MKKLSVVLIGTVLLAGCSAPGTPQSDPSPSASATASAHPEGWDFCDAFVPGMSAYADYILSAASGEVDMGAHSDMSSYIRAMRNTQPDSLSTVVDSYASPFDAIQEVVDAGGGSLTFNTDAYKGAVLPLMTFCNGVGYKISQ